MRDKSDIRPSSGSTPRFSRLGRASNVEKGRNQCIQRSSGTRTLCVFGTRTNILGNGPSNTQPNLYSFRGSFFSVFQCSIISKGLGLFFGLVAFFGLVVIDRGQLSGNNYCF